MKYFRILPICLFLLPSVSVSQVVETPHGPNLIDWQKDHERMKKAKVKMVKIYANEIGKKILSESIEFDTMGYITKEITMRNGTPYSTETTDWTEGYNSYQIYREENGKKYCFRKENYDSHGYTTETYLGQPDGSFDLQGIYSYNYNTNGSVNHSMQDWYGQKTESFFTYDKMGKMITAIDVTENNPEWNWEYTYDSVGRLIKEYWWEKEGKDTSMVAWSRWTYADDCRILKEEGKGRGWNDINYDWSNDTLKIDFNQGPEFGPSYNFVFQLSKDKKLVTHMETFTKKGWKEEEKWYEYEFY